MNKTRLILSAFLIFNTQTIFANLAQITKIRGNATYLSVGMKEAKPIELNQWLPKDTSILTNEKTFLVLTYKSGSEITLGPNSKLIVDTTEKKEQQLVSLLMGKLKATVKNQANNNENKMLIKTSGAALGIRGTEFQTNYNPTTKITSLITFHGSVAMTKIEPTAAAPNLTVEQIENKLKSEAVIVKLGEYSGVSQNVESISAPVKISPEQFTKLKLTETLGAVEEKIDQNVLQEELKKTEESYTKTKDDRPTSQVADAVTNKSGGFIDTDSGIYVPPAKDSSLNEKLNIFVASEKVGIIDNVGNYTPPKGLTLDPVQGFIADNKAQASRSNEDLANVAKELNESVAKQVQKPETVIKKKKNLENKDEDVYKKYYDPSSL